VVLGSLFLFRSSPAENFVSISKTVVIATSLLTALFFLFVVGMGLKAQRNKPASGIKAFVGKKGQALSLLDPGGTVKVNGEMWKAESLSGKINQGENIIVREIKNLTLYVEQV
jgi:membrane-bound serine protease (ClpP class)